MPIASSTVVPPGRRAPGTSTASRRLTVLVVALVGSAATARAQGYVHRGLDPGPVAEIPIELGRLGTVTIATSGSVGVDPIVRLIGPGGREVARDRDSGGAGEARLTYHAVVAGTYVALIHAERGTGPGTTTVGVGPTSRTVTVGGQVIASPERHAIVETAFVPGGDRDPTLYGIGPRGDVVAIDRDSGVGLGARLPRTVELAEVLVAGSIVRPGPIDVYVNAGPDLDRDGLGQELERALGTCDTTADPGCAKVPVPRDVDRDGLDDGAEVFGIDHPDDPLLLPRWGANPRHKDAFIEVDFPPTETWLALGPDDLAAIQQYYAAGPAETLGNLDGVDGIALHFDVGFAPPTAAGLTAFGAWGGGGRAVDADYRVAYARSFAWHRRGVFFYALIDSTGGGGQGAAGRLGARNFPATVAHELGHLFGLEHFGHRRWGAVNCKPNYPSIMNYAYNYQVGIGFSRGRFAPLDPSAVIEATTARPDPARPAEDKHPEPSLGRILARSNFRVSYVAQHGFDWNRDGVIGASGQQPTRAVRAGLTTASWTSCAAFGANATPLAQAALQPTATPRLVRLGGWLYALWIDDGGRLVYRRGATSGPDGQGSCPGGDDLGATCTTWSDPAAIPLADRVEAFSAVEFGGALAIAYRHGDIVRLVWTPRPDATGRFAAFTAEETLPTRPARGDLELAIIPPLGANPAPGARALALFYSDGAYRWLTTDGQGRPWTDRDYLRLLSGEYLEGVFGVSVVGWPARGVEGEPAPTTACMVAGARTAAVRSAVTVLPPDEPLRFLCLEPTTGAWHDRSAGFFDRAHQTAGRPGLAYHVFRDAKGVPLGKPARGQFVLTWTERFEGAKPDDPPALFTDVGWSGPVEAAGGVPSSLSLAGLTTVRDIWSFAPPGGGVHPYEDSQLSALKAVRIWRADQPWELEFSPLFDGTFGATLSDGDDFQVMERGLCLGLRPPPYCGGPNQWGY